MLYVFGVLYMLVILLWDELRAELSPAYRLERDREKAELLEQKRKLRQRYARNEGM